MISSIIAAFHAARNLFIDVRWLLHLRRLDVQVRLVRNWQSGVIRQILCDFFAEAAVLALIFPFLDVVVANNEIARSARLGTVPNQLISVPVVLRWSLAVVAVGLFGAFILGNKEDGE